MKRILTAFLFFFIACFASAQIEMDTVWLKNASVYANKSQILINTHFSDSIYHKHGFTWSTSDWLQKQNLLYAKNYGASGIQTVGIRGLGATQTAVLWNGMPMNNAMLGVADLSLIRGFFVDEMALSMGSSASLFGNASVGGTIQLNNELLPKKQMQIVGAFGSLIQYHLGLKSTYTINKKIMAATRVLASANQNDYTYINTYKPSNPKEKMTHAYENSLGVLQQVQLTLKKDWVWNHRLWAQNQIRQLPPSMVQNSSKARMDDKFLRYQTEVTKTTSVLKTAINFAYSNEQNIYDDTLAQIFNNNKVESYVGAYQADWNLKKGMLTIKSLYYSAFGSSNNYVGKAEQTYLNLSSKYAFFNDRTKGQFSAAFLMAKGNYFPVTAFLSVNYELTKTWLFYFATGNSFRLPTLNERFWSPGGNENIRPEESFHLEIGINKQTKIWGFKNHIYFTPTKNLVVWGNSANNIISPYNVSNITLICGNELSANQTLYNKKWRWVLMESYHLNFARTGRVAYWEQPQLPYVPLHRLSGEIRAMYKKWSFWYLHQFQSERNIDLGGSEQIEAYTIGNVVVQWENNHIATGLQLNNIFNTQYQLTAVRPMPGFNLQLNITYKLNNKK